MHILPNGVWYGEYVEFYPAGTPHIITNYIDDEIHGSYEQFYDNGRRYIHYNYKHGKLHGRCLEYYKYFDTPTHEYNYVEGVKHGKCISYYSNGCKERENEYVDGNLISVIEYDIDGEIFNVR
jgi:antitoxin component YwqK of YwqJK toxin-antitoxin module